MILKTLGRTEWDRLKIDEIFAIISSDNGVEIMVKRNKLDAMELTYTGTIHSGGIIWKDIPYNEDKFYKLPLATQNLWRTP